MTNENEICENCGKKKNKHLFIYSNKKLIEINCGDYTGNKFVPKNQSTEDEEILKEVKGKNPCGKYFKNEDRICGEVYNLARDFGFNQHNIFIMRTWYCPKCIKTTQGFLTGQEEERKSQKEKILEMINNLIKVRKGSLNFDISIYQEIFSINDLEALKNKIEGENK